MSIVCKELPNMTFTTKTEMFKALVEHKDKIMGLKKAAILKSCEKGQLGTFNLFKITEETKSLLGLKEGHIYAVINTTKYYDNHGDVHFDGIWNRSIKDQQGGIYYVENHNLSTKDVIAWPGDINVFTKVVPWSFVGKNYEGDTEALIYEVPVDKIVSPNAKEIIEQKRPVQNSVRMQYVKMRLGINSNEKEFAEYKAYYDSRINEIANKEAVEEAGFFWGQEEAKIIKEGSMVLFGSNDATPIQYPEAAGSTSEKAEPGKPTHELTNFLSKIKI